MRKIWNKIVEWLLAIPQDKRLHFAAGMIIAAFFAVALGREFSFWLIGGYRPFVWIAPVLVLAVLKEMIDGWTGGSFEWLDILATALGGLLIVIFGWLHCLLYGCPLPV